MTIIKSIKGIREIIDNYDLFILDQWGVMHNGHNGYDDAIKCVEFLHKKNKEMIIISNSSKRKQDTIKRLPALGFNENYFIEIMTSGEMIWQSLKNLEHEFSKSLKKNCFHIYDISKNDNKNFVKGLDNFNFVKDIDEADFILGCSVEKRFKTIDYVPLLTKALEKKLPFICANPDFISIEQNASDFLICMGSVAELYRKLGGKIFILGKPEIEIYKKSTLSIKNIEKSKIIAIGDSLDHDIKGANNFQVDSLLITSGIHRLNFDKNKPIWESNINNLKNNTNLPTFLCSNFKL